VVYERSAELGWRHVPDRSGWLGTCEGEGLPPTPVEIDSEGLVGPARGRDKPPGTVRFLLLGGNLPDRLASVERQGYRLHLPNSVRLTGAGHMLAAGYVWSFLRDNGLLPQALVPARVAGSGHAIPDLASLPRMLGDPCGRRATS
jgi:hypothetical protein